MASGTVQSTDTQRWPTWPIRPWPLGHMAVNEKPTAVRNASKGGLALGFLVVIASLQPALVGGGTGKWRAALEW